MSNHQYLQIEFYFQDTTKVSFLLYLLYHSNSIFEEIDHDQLHEMLFESQENILQPKFPFFRFSLISSVRWHKPWDVKCFFLKSELQTIYEIFEF